MPRMMAYVPGVGWVYLQGGAQSTDNNNQVSAPFMTQLAPSTVLIGGVNVQDPSIPGQKLKVNADGSLNITPIGSTVYNNASVGVNGAAIPVDSTQIGASDGTNLQQLLVESASHPNLRAALFNGANQQSVDANGGAITASEIQFLIQAGKGFTYSTGKQTSAGSVQTGLSLFNPGGSGKTLLIYGAMCSDNSNGTHFLVTGITTDPALGTPAIVLNRKLSGGAASAMSATFANAAVVTGTGGTIAESKTALGQVPIDFLVTPGDCIVVPAGFGVELLVTTTTNAWMATFKGLEF